MLDGSWYTGTMKNLSLASVTEVFPGNLLDTLAIVYHDLPGDVYLSGGTVRDMMLARKPADIDLTVVRHARQWASRVARMTGGTYVELGREEDAARVVLPGLDLDFTSFREGASSIEQELKKRDITINSMALPIHGILRHEICADEAVITVIDPLGGVDDLAAGLVRLNSARSFVSDPLRMLRVFRFAGVLDFTIEAATLAQVRLQRHTIERVAAERVARELDLLMSSPGAHACFIAMAECGLLWIILPELRAGVGMDQPASHHLDVFSHCLETLRQMEVVLVDTAAFFPAQQEVMAAYLAQDRRPLLLKWAALFHDIGKPATFGINEDKGGRITFYNHDLQGAEIFGRIADRLRWSSRESRYVAGLITAHMRPFFLANNQRQGALSFKACLRLVRAIGDHLPGLFLLAMADALAGKGEGSPAAIEKEVADIFDRLMRVETEHVAPVRKATPLITGKDLITALGLEPGPLFREILEKVEESHMAHTIHTREQALSLARQLAADRAGQARCD